MKKEFDNKPICNMKFLKTKKNSYSDEVTNFHDKKIRKESSNYNCLSEISINFAFLKKENAYLEVCLKECKTHLKKR